MKRIDNSMITSLFNTAQFLNKFNTSPIIKPDVKVNLQAPLALYHERKDACRTIIVNNTSDESITKPPELIFAQTRLKKIKVSAVMDQSNVVSELESLNTFLNDNIIVPNTPDVTEENGGNGGNEEGGGGGGNEEGEGNG